MYKVVSELENYEKTKAEVLTRQQKEALLGKAFSEFYGRGTEVRYTK